jgi:hypothetical protein
LPRIMNNNPISRLWAQFREAIDAPSEKLHDFVSRTWLFGTLVNCTSSNFLGAFYELFHAIIFATMPFWLGGLILTVVPSNHPVELPEGGFYDFWLPRYWASSISTFNHGELLVFAISLLSPTLWLATHEPEGAGTLPHRRPISTMAVMIIIVGAVLFAVLKSGSQVYGSAIFWVSVCLTILALVLRYLVLVYHGYRLKPATEKDLLKGTEDWMSRVETHRQAVQ